MAKLRWNACHADKSFWYCAFNDILNPLGVMFEQNLLLNRKNEATNEYFVNYRRLVKDSRLYICTTMYHEESYEMEQLLNSLGGIDCARKEAGRKFEAHIFFDDGVRDKTLKKYALQLLSLVEKTLGIKASFAQKVQTPYGMKLQWRLPGGMDFHIHLKDNYKVMLYYIILYYVILYYIMLYYVILLYYIILYFILLYII